MARTPFPQYIASPTIPHPFYNPLPLPQYFACLTISPFPYSHLAFAIPCRSHVLAFLTIHCFSDITRLSHSALLLTPFPQSNLLPQCAIFPIIPCFSPNMPQCSQNSVFQQSCSIFPTMHWFSQHAPRSHNPSLTHHSQLSHNPLLLRACFSAPTIQSFSRHVPSFPRANSRPPCASFPTTLYFSSMPLWSHSPFSNHAPSFPQSLALPSMPFSSQNPIIHSHV